MGLFDCRAKFGNTRIKFLRWASPAANETAIPSMRQNRARCGPEVELQTIRTPLLAQLRNLFPGGFYCKLVVSSTIKSLYDMAMAWQWHDYGTTMARLWHGYAEAKFGNGCTPHSVPPLTQATSRGREITLRFNVRLQAAAAALIHSALLLYNDSIYCVRFSKITRWWIQNEGCNLPGVCSQQLLCPKKWSGRRFWSQLLSLVPAKSYGRRLALKAWLILVLFTHLHFSVISPEYFYDAGLKRYPG